MDTEIRFCAVIGPQAALWTSNTSVLDVLYKINSIRSAHQIVMCSKDAANVNPGWVFYGIYIRKIHIINSPASGEKKKESLMSSSNNFWSSSTDNECQTDFMAARRYPEIKFPGKRIHLLPRSS